MKATIPLVLLGCMVGLLVLVAYPAQSGPEIGLEYARAIPGVPGPLNALKSCTVAVDNNPDGGTDLVQCSGTAGYSEIFCENRSSTAVYYGNRTDDLDSVAPCISNDSATCGRDAFRFSVRNGQLGADTASGSVTLYCTEGR